MGQGVNEADKHHQRHLRRVPGEEAIAYMYMQQHCDDVFFIIIVIQYIVEHADITRLSSGDSFEKLSLNFFNTFFIFSFCLIDDPTGAT